MRLRERDASRNRWSASCFPAGLDEALVRVRSRVVDRVGPEGAVRDPCHGRVFESALALRLFDRTGLWPPGGHRLADYLRRCARTGSPLDRVLAGAALAHRTTRSDAVIQDFLDGTPDFTGTRKRALLDAFFALCGRPVPALPDLAAFSRSGLHSWAVVQVTATKVVLADAVGRPDLVDDEDARLLLETQRPSHVWEDNILLHLWVLHALDRLPGTRAVVARGIGKLAAHQRGDGSLPFITDTDTWCTATAGVALASAGAPAEVLRRIATHLGGQQRPGGGWSYTDSSFQTDIDDTSVVLQFLHILGGGVHDARIERGIRSLYAVRGRDGGFPTYVTGAPSEACMTAAALDALTPWWADHSRTIVSGLDFLAEHQRDDGSFPPDWSAGQFHTVFRVLLAADRNLRHRPPRVAAMVARALALILRHHNDDGGWGRQPGDGSDPISTAYALIALCGQDDPEPAARAAGYLVGGLGEGGAVRSTPDSIGPRPFVFTIPVLADIFVLLALAHLAHRITPAVHR